MTMFARAVSVFGCAMALSLGPAAEAQDLKVAFIDLDRAFNALDRTKRGHEKVEEAKEDFRKEIEGMNKELETLLAEQDAIAEEALNPALTEEIRRTRREEGEVKAVEISEYRSQKNKLFKERERQLQKQILRMRQDIIDEIASVASDYARDNGYVMVLDITGQSINQVPLILYADTKYDITDAIVELINAQKE